MPNGKWPEVYKKLGVRPIINAQSWVTSLGGSLMRPEVLSAMEEASTVFVDMIELNKSAGKVIARVCDSEGGLVTSGCSAAQVLMVAACMTGNDDLKVEQLPDTTGMKNNVVMFKGHRNRYDKAFQTPGAMIVEFGNSTDASDYQLESAIDGNTCAVAYVIMPFSKSGVGLKKTIDIAHKHGVPVIVDAAAEVPPRSNLSKFISMGVDMVAFSGGKGIGGPQSTGVESPLQAREHRNRTYGSPPGRWSRSLHDRACSFPLPPPDRLALGYRAMVGRSERRGNDPG